MTADDEPLAIALWVERTQGAQAEVYIAGQIGALALRGDAAGIERWKSVAAQHDALVRGARQ